MESSRHRNPPRPSCSRCSSSSPRSSTRTTSEPRGRGCRARSFAGGSGHRARNPLRWRSHGARRCHHRASAASRTRIPFRGHSRHALTVVRRRGQLTLVRPAGETPERPLKVGRAVSNTERIGEVGVTSKDKRKATCSTPETACNRARLLPRPEPDLHQHLTHLLTNALASAKLSPARVKRWRLTHSLVRSVTLFAVPATGQAISGTRRCAIANSKSHSSSTSACAS